MQPSKLRILSAITAGGLAVAVVAITASSGTGHAARHAVLAAQTESFPAVNLYDCPVLHTGYPRGGCVAQLQTDLNALPGNHLDVNGLFGPVGSQTYEAVIAFQAAHGLDQDGMVGPDTKKALYDALSVHTPRVPPAKASGDGAPTTTPEVPLDPSCLASTASSCGDSPPINHETPGLNEILGFFFG